MRGNWAVGGGEETSYDDACPRGPVRVHAYISPPLIASFSCNPVDSGRLRATGFTRYTGAYLLREIGRGGVLLNVFVLTRFGKLVDNEFDDSTLSIRRLGKLEINGIIVG